jgi:hypothetical protein
MWAGVTRRFAILKTPHGLERMSDRGLMTSRQLEVLQSLDVPNNELHNAPLQWMMIQANRAIQNGTLAGDNATKSQLLKQITELRATYTAISDKLAGRMPLAYAHLVQILVDTFVLIAPFALSQEADIGGTILTSIWVACFLGGMFLVPELELTSKRRSGSFVLGTARKVALFFFHANFRGTKASKQRLFTLLATSPSCCQKGKKTAFFGLTAMRPFRLKTHMTQNWDLREKPLFGWLALTCPVYNLFVDMFISTASAP